MRLYLGIVLVAVGASVGAVLRWLLTLALNHLSLKLDIIHFGTLIANLLGAFIAGFFMMLVVQKTSFSDEWKLLIITGFCGGLTTFSSFSTEVVSIIMQGRLGIAFLGVFAHLFGSLSMTFVGILLAQNFNKIIN